MARRDRGDPLTSLKPQPGRQLAYKQDGTISGQVKYRCDAAKAFSLRPSIGARHPDDSKAQCYNAVVTIMENGLAEITCDYLGIANNPTPAQIEFLGNTGEEAIETHKDFISKIGGTADQPKNEALYDDETGEFLGFPVNAPHDLGGVRGFLAPACTIRVSYYTTNSSMGLWTLGDIAAPPSGVPRPPDSRNWLKTNWSRRDFGLIYQITEEYTASGKRGWNKLIYG